MISNFKEILKEVPANPIQQSIAYNLSTYQDDSLSTFNVTISLVTEFTALYVSDHLSLLINCLFLYFSLKFFIYYFPFINLINLTPGSRSITPGSRFIYIINYDYL